MKYLHLFLLCYSPLLFAQVDYTANDQIPPYAGHFRFGTNMGAYSNWTDDDLANIAIGNPDLHLPGAGVSSLRPILPEYFLDYWGYDIRLNTFQHYASLGADENTVFVGYPAPQHQDATQYCPGVQSQLFTGMYLDIWDAGAGGTPINEDNHYAAYLYRTVSRYGGQVKFWEIWNEPDLDFSGNGWKPRGEAGNWFENVPAPCDYALRAPVFHYIRLLRISYEVIKTVDPTAYVAVGGLGYPGFLDLLLRHTDNPDGGKVTADFPLRGGAYFDVLSYHAYPHFDGSLREWSNEAGGFVYQRHSDAAMKGVLNKKKEFRDVLRDYGYNGSTYPAKLWIITESNLPRKAFGEYIGSDEAQRNFLLKTLVACQQEDIHQFHLYNLAESATEVEASQEFELMGLYQKLEGSLPYQQVPNEVAIAGRTYRDLLYRHRYDAAQTARLALPNRVRGAAFRDPATGDYTYVLWARTKRDRSENAAAQYSFPADLGVAQVEVLPWDHSQTGQREWRAASDLDLSGSPVFVRPTLVSSVATAEEVASSAGLATNPGPTTELWLTLQMASDVTVAIYDARGQLVEFLVAASRFERGSHRWAITGTDWPAGEYYIHWRTVEDRGVLPWVKVPE